MFPYFSCKEHYSYALLVESGKFTFHKVFILIPDIKMSFCNYARDILSVNHIVLYYLLQDKMTGNGNNCPNKEPNFFKKHPCDDAKVIIIWNLSYELDFVQTC